MRALHKAAYHDVVLEQFGRWDDLLQASLFTQKCVPEKFEIVEWDGKSIGCISIENHTDVIYLAEIQILPEFQGHGIATELIETEIRRAGELKKPLRLQVLLKNGRARAFYERLGFTCDGTTATHFKMSYRSG